MTWNNFSRDEFACGCGCETNEIKDETIDLAQEIRDQVGFAMPITSGYRCGKHPIEARKAKPGTHAKGLAFDVGVSGGKARLVTQALLRRSAGGVGVNQKGKGRFVHGDLDPARIGLFWTY